MTAVTYETAGDMRRIRLTGHATGSTRMCAAISGIVYALAAGLCDAEDAEIKTLKLEPGDVEIAFIGGIEANAMMKSAVSGLRLLARDYPTLITIQDRL